MHFNLEWGPSKILKEMKVKNTAAWPSLLLFLYNFSAWENFKEPELL